MFKHFILFSILTYGSLSFAGGPLVIEGRDGITPVTYQDPNITLHIENGDLGSLTNEQADALVLDAFTLWNDISTATVNMVIDQSQLNLDIDIDNFETYLPSTDGSSYNADDNLNPVVYDETGEIIDAFFGAGQSDYTIGFAASILTVGSSHFDEGYAVINGKLNLSDIELKLLIAHEIAHFFGLDHTQVDIDNQETNFGSPAFCSSDQGSYPLMYPIICRDEETLHQDDISAISALYPSTDINNYFGILQGRFVDETNTAVLGANIWAKNTVTGETVSIVSDYLTQKTGFYKLYLPAGSYTLHANSINTLFNGGSGVGPYSLDINDASFLAPHPISEVVFQGGSAGSDEVITISNNQTLVIDFAIDGSTAVIPVADNDDDDSIADLFGATSHMTLLVLFSLLFGHRISRNRQQED